MRTIVILSACVIALAAADAQARMYQWSNPSSGIVQLSGSPPAWYRSTTQGPRVLVFDNGQLIDDTAVIVGEPVRQSLRAAAFTDEDTVAAAPTATPPPRERLRDALAAAADEGVNVQAVAEAFTTEQTSTASPQGAVEQTVAELKSLLDAWDSRRLDEAKSLLLENDARGDGN